MCPKIAREADGWYVRLATACSAHAPCIALPQSGPGGDSCLLSAAPLPVVDGLGNRIRKPLQP
jgi:hypothetical protein